MQGPGQEAAEAATQSNTAAQAANSDASAAFPEPPRTIDIIGAGFSGACLAIQLLRQATRARLNIRLIDPRDTPGAGAAYAVRDYPYPLNVACGSMSLDASAPDDFLKFARAQGIDASPGDYLPRQFYGEYLHHRFLQASREAPANLRAVHHQARVLQLRRASDGRFESWLDDGSARRADEVVLAIGNAPPARLDVFKPIAAACQYIDDPWTIGSCGHEDVNSVLLVGSGLTMIDAALRLAALRPRVRRIYVLSRHGLLPQSQADSVRRAVKPDLRQLQSADKSARALMRELRALAAGISDAGGDWRELLVAIRPHLPAIWSGLDAGERARFLRHARAWWEVHRHRAPAGALSAVRTLERTGVLEVHAGRLESLQLLDGSVEVQWRPRGESRNRAWLVDRVINCTGPDSRVAGNTDPLVQSLLGGGWIRPDAHGLGIDVDADGRVISRTGESTRGLYYLGPWLRARDWEATAVPELRVHAARLARQLTLAADSRLPALP
jgi:uncharacterized NAD(P)/FAD-binding protein YdhS